MQLDKTAKRLLAGLLILGVLLMAGPATYGAIVYKLWLCDAATGGTSTSLDGIHSGTSGVPDGAFAMVFENSTSRFYMFRFNSGVTANAHTGTTHPWAVQPINGPVLGVWLEIAGVTPFK